MTRTPDPPRIAAILHTDEAWFRCLRDDPAQITAVDRDRQAVPGSLLHEGSTASEASTALTSPRRAARRAARRASGVR